jgi:hypothetical protein
MICPQIPTVWVLEVKHLSVWQVFSYLQGMPREKLISMWTLLPLAFLIGIVSSSS